MGKSKPRTRKHAQKGQILNNGVNDAVPPVWEIAISIGAAVPPEEWAKVPPDLSQNLDHYLYGTPKAST